MKSEKNILIAFLLNIAFSIFEIIGGIFTNSIAIISDALHDFGDAISIGISYLLEKKSKKGPDNNYTYGYVRYSVIGAIITNTILIIGSILVIFNSIRRIINPVTVNHDGMIAFALIGVVINFLAVYFTKDGKSLNQKAVNLHMLEDVLGWLVVLVGAIVIKITKIDLIDSILSFIVAIFILVNALKGYVTIVDLFLEKTPKGINIDEIKRILLEINDISDVHHIHIWSIDGVNNYATMHIVTKLKNVSKLKEKIKSLLKENNIVHTTIEFETESDKCVDLECHIDVDHCSQHHH